MREVREFHTAFDLPILDEPRIPKLKRVALRAALIEEEFKEVMAELAFIKSRPRVEQWKSAADVYAAIARLAKELADLRYVVEGSALEFGIPFDAVYSEVHRSNMSKLGRDGKPVRRHDGKVLKGPDYTEADVLLALGIINMKENDHQ